MILRQYVRNDPVNFVDPDGRFRCTTPGCNGELTEDMIYGPFGRDSQAPWLRPLGPRYVLVDGVGHAASDSPIRPFERKIINAIKDAKNKLAHASKDCLDLLAVIGVSVEDLTQKMSAVDYKNGATSQDILWRVMGGQINGTVSTTTVGDVFRMGEPPWPSQTKVDGLSASNGTVYLRLSAVGWENVIHEVTHQFGSLGHYSDTAIMQRMADFYGNYVPGGGIDANASTQQISNKIKEKCN